jgi:hypothetical protein
MSMDTILPARTRREKARDKPHDIMQDNARRANCASLRAACSRQRQGVRGPGVNVLNQIPFLRRPHQELPLLLVGLAIPCSAGQEAQPQETPPQPLGPGDHTRTLAVGGQEQTYLVHIPKGYDPKKHTPVVLALHGAAMNGSMMVWFSGLNKKSDKAGFIMVYPSGTGIGPFCTWNAGNFGGYEAARGRLIQAHHFCLNSFRLSNQRMLRSPPAKQSARSTAWRAEKWNRLRKNGT